ncbi:MAG: hypothetical protein ABJB86_23335 [Bacteroidota bacterium]
MVHDFKIRFTIRTSAGFEPICDFYLGNNRTVALSIFSELEGNDEVCESDILQLDWVETKGGLPVDVKIKHCTLSQLGRSCSFITKELFKYRNLMQGG